MPTGHDTPRKPPTIQDTASHTPESEHNPDATDMTAGAEHVDGEAALRIWEGLSPQARILVPTFITPMRQPDRTWAMLVNAVDLVGEIACAAELELFAGTWLTEQPPADLCDGDLVTGLTPHDNGAGAVDVEMLLACHGHWHRVGFWPHLDTTWPMTVAPTAAAVMGLRTGLAESSARHITAALTAPGSPSDRGTIRALLDAELVTPGDEFLWERRNSNVHHTARVRIDGTLALADGRLCATPDRRGHRAGRLPTTRLGHVPPDHRRPHAGRPTNRTPLPTTPVATRTSPTGRSPHHTRPESTMDPGWCAMRRPGLHLEARPYG